MNARGSGFGFGAIVFAFVATLMAGPFNANAAEPGSLQIRRVVDEKDSPGAEAVPFAHPRSGGESSLRVMKKSDLDGRDVASAVAQKNSATGESEVLVTLTEKGTQRFAALTERSVGKWLAVIVDGKIVAAPVVRTKIPGGSMVVSGNMTAKEADELAEKLNGEGESKK